MAEFRVTYDPEAMAAYIAVSPGLVSTTSEVVKDRIFFDLDSEGRLVGVEAIGIAADTLPSLLGAVRDTLLRAESAMGEDRERLLAIAR